jgi:uncharacterized repeat protein (TIGR03803 family)
MHRLHLSVLLISAVLAVQSDTTSGATLTTVYQFSGPDGASPVARLLQASDGNFYGTTQGGGTYSQGTVYRVSSIGSLTTLWSFGGGTDGASPQAGLVQGSDGNFYGTTYSGGNYGVGTVFRITAGGSLSNLWSFTGGTDGANPQAGLVQGSDGNFYGTTLSGGPSTNCPGGCGTVFKISSAGSLTTLYSFTGINDGWGGAPVVQGSDGNFYGTTQVGGIYSNGAIYRVSSTGSFTNLYSFTGGSDGAAPFAGLVLGSDGNFYDTTFAGGQTNCPPFGCGTVFKISQSGSLATLWSFDGGADGANPAAALLQGSDGNFYGTTQSGGANGQGTVYQIGSTVGLTNLYSFAGDTNGAGPVTGLVQGSDGNFYWTMYNGGTNYLGTVFKLIVTLNPPPNQITTARIAGSNFIFNVSSIAGATYQLQFRTDLTSGLWSNVPGVSVSNSIGGILTLTNFAGANQPPRFFRFAITP